MAFTINAEAGSASANSYASVQEGNDYWASRLYSDTWDEAGDEDKARALSQATRMLDSWFEWYGTITSLSQALLWPRSGVIRPGVSDAPLPDAIANPWHQPFAVLLDQDTVPDQVREATAELAGQLLVSDRSADSDIETQGLRSLTAGSVSLTFSGSVEAKPIPDAVMSLASQVGRPRSKSGSGSVDLRRG